MNGCIFTVGATERTRTSTGLLPPAPQAGVSTISPQSQILSGAESRSRTHNPLIRSQMLYPIELFRQKPNFNKVGYMICLFQKKMEYKTNRQDNYD